MAWRRLRAGECDHEALWLGVSLAAAGTAWMWTEFGMPTPRCAFHALVGWPCPSCGGTRCFVHLAHGSWSEAFLANPLVFAGFAAVAVFDLYALGVLVTTRSRWRWEPSARQALALRVAAVALLALNWAWVIRAGM